MDCKLVDIYGMRAKGDLKEGQAPALDYLPAKTNYPARIAMIGCGSESYLYLTAYLRAGYNVTAFYDSDPVKARVMRDQFYPSAAVVEDYRRILDDSNVDIVDVGDSGDLRLTVLTDAVRAGKHILSQKYFVDSLDDGQALAGLAAANRVKLAVNQDACWAPGWRYAVQVIRAGLIGKVASFNAHAVWNHNWLKASLLDNEKYSILFEFGIHWFDILNMVMNREPANAVSAFVCATATQMAKAPLLMETVIKYPHAMAGLGLDGDAISFAMDRTIISGDNGVIVSEGPDRMEQEVWFVSGDSIYRPKLEGDWLPGGYHGTMAELIKAVEEDREPENSVFAALEAQALCYAAIASAEHGRLFRPGEAGARRAIGQNILAAASVPGALDSGRSET